jgi:hypothetical protein
MTWNGSTAPCHAAEEPRVAPRQPPPGGDPPRKRRLSRDQSPRLR